MRVIYYFVAAHDHILLVVGYGKNEKDDLAAHERAVLGQKAHEYKAELEARSGKGRKRRG